MLDRKSIDDYLKLVDFNILDDKHFEIIDFVSADKSKFSELENSIVNHKEQNIQE